METRDDETVLEAEIIDGGDRGSAPLPARDQGPDRGGGLLRWFLSSSRGQAPGGGPGGGQGSGGRMMRRRGKRR